MKENQKTSLDLNITRPEARRGNWKTVVITLVFILVLALALRLYNLNLLPVFVDEAIYIRWSQIMAAESSLRFLPLSDGKQPLFMWALMFVVRRFADPLFIGRLISVVSGVGTVIGLFFLTYNLFKSRFAALLSALIWAISPFSLFFDRMALVDSMLASLGVWTILFAVLTSKTKRLDFAIITGFLLGLSMLTKSPALFLLLLMPSTWLLVRKPIRLIKLGALTLLSWIIAFGMFNILRLGPNFHLLAQRNLDYVYPYDHILTSPLNPLMGHLGGIWGYFVMLAPVGLIFLIILGFLENRAKFMKEILLLMILGLAPILIVAEYSKVVTARYILFALPFLVVLAGSAVLVKKNMVKAVVWAALLMFFVQSLFIDSKLLIDVEAAPLPQGERSGYLEEWTAGQGIREISEYIKSEHAKNTDVKIVIGTEGYFGTLPDGLQMYLEGVENVITIGIGLGIDKVPESLAESKKSGNKTYLVINKSRLVEDPDKIGLDLIASFPKALRKVGSIEYERMGPQEILYFFEVVKAD